MRPWLTAPPDPLTVAPMPDSIARRYLLTDAEVAQILYCLESMQSDYTDGTPDAADFDAALAALQSPLTPGS